MTAPTKDTAATEAQGENLHLVDEGCSNQQVEILPYHIPGENVGTFNVETNAPSLSVGKSQGQWQPIESAPTELNNYDDPLDIWVRNNRDGHEWREVQCHLAANRCWVNGAGKWFTGKTYYDRIRADEVYDPSCTDEQSIVATHWLRPQVPNASVNASEWISKDDHIAAVGEIRAVYLQRLLGTTPTDYDAVARVEWQEKFCIAFIWAYGTALERNALGREPNDGLTPQQLWDQSSEEDREFLSVIVREASAALPLKPTARPEQTVDTTKLNAGQLVQRILKIIDCSSILDSSAELAEAIAAGIMDLPADYWHKYVPAKVIGPPEPQQLARIIFEKMENCTIRDPNWQFAEDSRAMDAARAILAALSGTFIATGEK